MAFLGKETKFVDIRKEGLDTFSKNKLIESFGENLINRKSRTWRELTSNERNKSVSDLMSDHPTVIKRPVIFSQEQIYIGWSQDIGKKLKS